MKILNHTRKSKHDRTMKINVSPIS